jgi:UDP-glucose 4-epimerase
LGSEKTFSIQNIFQSLLKISGKAITTQTDDTLLRNADSEVLVADCSLARRVLGWQPAIAIEQSLRDIYQAFNKII